MSVDGRGSPFLQMALLGEAAEHLDAAVFVWDDTRNYVAVNDAACGLAGVTREQLLAMRVGDLSPNGYPTPQFRQAQRESKVSGHSTIHRPDGEVIEVDFIAFHSRVAGLPYVVSICWPTGA